jgi:hypothetical protein
MRWNIFEYLRCRGNISSCISQMRFRTFLVNHRGFEVSCVPHQAKDLKLQYGDFVLSDYVRSLRCCSQHRRSVSDEVEKASSSSLIA